MAYTPDILSLSNASLEAFLALLPQDRVTRQKDCITVHAECGDALWFQRHGRWITSIFPGSVARFARQGPQKPHDANQNAIPFVELRILA